MKLPDEATSHGIALKFCEKFQENYPQYSSAWVLMEDLRQDIDNLIQAKLNSERTLYGVDTGSVWEGGGCGDELYLTLELAREAALKQIGPRQKEDDIVYEDAPKVNDLPKKWREEGLNYWTNRIWYVRVCEFTLNKKTQDVEEN
jgi:hypothetical protein